ncbi:unnamed protein product, partial [Symbiodinium necroappetens]
AAAELWITTALEDPDLQESGLGEYVTAAEDLDGLPLEDHEGGEADEEGAVDAGELARLRARLHALELSANTAPPAGAGIGGFASRGPSAQARRGARDLFPPSGSAAITDADMQRLREAAGPPPEKIAQHEREPRGALTRQADDLLAEIEAGAIQDEGLPAGGSNDSVLERLFLIQTQMLARLSAGKPRSPLEAALGSGGGKDDASLSAKGSAARDAYVRLLKDNVAVAEQIRRLAAEELGEDVQAPPPNLMRTLWKRGALWPSIVPWPWVSMFAAHGWEQAREKRNADLEASAVGASTTAPSCNGHPEVVSVVAGLSCKPVVADRIKWSLPPSFDPVPFLLDPEIKRAYLEPDSVKLPEALWPKLPRSKVHASRGELLKLAAKWDKFKALRIFNCSEVDSLETVGCFGVPKDISFDRLCCDDLSEMYYTFVVPPLRFVHECNCARKRRFVILKSLPLLILRIPLWAWCPTRGNVNDKSLLAPSSVQMWMDAKVWFRHRGTASEY